MSHCAVFRRAIQWRTGRPDFTGQGICPHERLGVGNGCEAVVAGGFDLTLDSLHPIDRAALALSHSLDRIHFTAGKLTRGIHATAKAQRAILALKPSDLCGDVKAAAAGGFTADPPGTTAFLAALGRMISGSAEPLPNVLEKVKAYLTTTRDRRALTHATTVNARYEKFSIKLALRWGNKLGSALVSAPLPGGGTPGFPTNPPASSSTRTAVSAAFAAL